MSSVTKNRILVKGGRVVNYDKSFLADVYIEDGTIKEVGENLNPAQLNATKTIDASGKLVIPGGIDSNTYLEYFTQGTRTADDFFTGTKAALAGGTTTIINFVLEDRDTPLLEAYNLNKLRAEKKACCDYAFHVCVRNFNEQVEKDLEVLAKEKGVNSFKAFLAFKNKLQIPEEEFVKFLKKCKELGALAQVHAENGNIIEEAKEKIKNLGIKGPEGHLLSHPELAEADAALHAIATANELNCPLYIVNVMSKLTASIIADARKRGNVVFGEPLIASLATDGTHYFNKCWRHSAGHICSPPLRDDPSTPSYLIDLLSNGDLELVSSNHCVFNTNQKALGLDDWENIPCGVNGIEDRMSLLWTRGVHNGKMSPSKFVAVTSTNAAKLFNIFPQKGYISKGSDGDLVIWDPNATKIISAESHKQAVDFNIFEGMSCYGVPSIVISNGKVVYENGTLTVDKGCGRLVKTSCFPEYVYERINQRDNIKPVQVEREPYTGSVVDLTKDIETLFGEVKLGPQPSQNASFHHRPPTKSGGRNMQDSSFSFSGQQFDDQRVKPTSRVSQPPGGKSSGIW